MIEAILAVPDATNSTRSSEIMTSLIDVTSNEKPGTFRWPDSATSNIDKRVFTAALVSGLERKHF